MSAGSHRNPGGFLKESRGENEKQKEKGGTEKTKLNQTKPNKTKKQRTSQRDFFCAGSTAYNEIIPERNEIILRSLILLLTFSHLNGLKEVCWKEKY